MSGGLDFDEVEVRRPEDRFVRCFAGGETIFEEGDRGDEMYVVLAGAVSIAKRTASGLKNLALLGKGDFFGEMAVVESAPRTAWARAEEDGTRVLAIDQARFVYLVSQQPAFALTIMEGMSRRLRVAAQAASV